MTFEDFTHAGVGVRKDANLDAQKADGGDRLERTRCHAPRFGAGERFPAFLEHWVDLGGRERWTEATLDDFLPEDFGLGVLRAAFERQWKRCVEDGGFDFDAVSLRASCIHGTDRRVREEQGAC